MKIKRLHVSLMLIATSVLVFVATIFATRKYVSEKVWKRAEVESQAMVQYAASRINFNMLLVQRGQKSFLSSWFHYADSSFQSDTVMTILDKDLQRFRERVFSGMKDYLKGNDGRISSCFFIIEPGACPGQEYKHSVAYASYEGEYCFDATDKMGHMLLEQYSDISKMDKSCFVYRKTDKGHDNGAISYCTPLRRQDGSVFGVFSADMSFSLFDSMLVRTLPFGYEESAFIILDKEGRTICSTSPFINSVPDMVNGSKDGVYEGDKFFIYSEELKHDHWELVTLCSTDAIYRDADSTVYRISVIFLIGTIIMLVCCALAARQVRKDVSDKTAAESELRIAAKVQSNMLKNNTLEERRFKIETWIKPALEAGGDLYDYIRRGDLLIFMIGDVSGKGMPAALFMTQVCCMFRCQASLYDNPGKIVTRINDVLSENNVDNTFCTMTAGVLNLVTGTLELCNAGHNKPIVFRNGKPGYVNLKSNIAVATLDGFDFETDTVQLAPGDSIFLYTDGVNEAKNKDKDMFGYDRLLETLSGKNIPDLEAVVADIRRFTELYPQSDDITMVSCTFKG